MHCRLCLASPFSFLKIALVADGAGAVPLPSYMFAEPNPTKSTTFELSGDSTVSVLFAKTILPLEAAKFSMPGEVGVKSGEGSASPLLPPLPKAIKK